MKTGKGWKEINGEEKQVGKNKCSSEKKMKEGNGSEKKLRKG